MMAEGLWQGRPRRQRHRTRRQRRECFGELVQLDASLHAWFEGRGEAEPVLITLIDDATGRRMQRLYEADGTAPTMDLLGRWLRKYGRMLAVYGDRAGHYVVNRPPSDEEALAGRQAETQVGRALRELQIDYIAANSPQAKGRVERSHGVDQDRLIKELRLQGISTIEQANRFLETEYTPMCNRRFAVPAASSVDADRLRPEGHPEPPGTACGGQRLHGAVPGAKVPDPAAEPGRRTATVEGPGRASAGRLGQAPLAWPLPEGPPDRGEALAPTGRGGPADLAGRSPCRCGLRATPCGLRGTAPSPGVETFP
jgi:hypothetical protein